MAGRGPGDPVKVIHGPINCNEVSRLFSSSRSPVLFKNMIENWKSRQWSIDYFCNRFSDITTTYKVIPLLDKPKNFTAPIMETDCIYVKAKVGDLIKWLNNDISQTSPLSAFHRDHFAIYIAYKYMKEMLINEHEVALKEIDWGVFGFHERNGEHSTIWIGSENAFTPLHKDTYGCNIVAQLYGKKSWTLFHPDDSDKLYPVRIPFEESSIFSAVDIHNVDEMKFPNFKDAAKQEVILGAGDVLFVPKHWWHFVKNIESSISVNMWVEKENDDIDQLKEAIVRLLVSSLKRSDCENKKYWLNPDEDILSGARNLEYVKLTMERLLSRQYHLNEEKKKEAKKRFENCDLLINCLTSDTILDKLIQQLFTTFNLK